MPEIAENTISSEIISQFDDAEASHREVRGRGFAWDDREDFFFGRYKNAKEGTKSVYSTGELQGLTIDAACRVMAQMATGRFTSIEDDEIANVIAANLIYHYYVLPNANTGGDFFTKSRQVNIYSHVYGTMPTFIDWVVSDRYIGPDPVLVHPRRFRPQPGKYAIEDMDWCFIETTATKKWLEERAKAAPEVWKNIDKVQESEVDTGSMTTEERKAVQGKKLVVLRHYFTREGDWKIYDAASKVQLVDEKKYFPRIPIVDKQTIPLLDRYWGLGSYERGETPQKAIDTLIRMYLDGVATSIEPPLIMDPEQVVLSTIVRQPKAKWFVKNGNTGAITPARLNPEGLVTFQSTYNIIKANLLSLGATTDTAISKSQDLGFGKTPEALRQQAQREGARDAWDRYMQERYLEKVANLSMDMICHKGLDEAKIHNIDNALEKIKTSYPGQDMTIFEDGRIKKDYIKGHFRYEVDPGSTMKRDDAGAKTMELLMLAVKNPKIESSLLAGNKKIDWGEALKRVAIENGIQDWDKIIVSDEMPETQGETTGNEGAVLSKEDGTEGGLPAPEGQPAEVTPEQIASMAQQL